MSNEANLIKKISDKEINEKKISTLSNRPTNYNARYGFGGLTPDKLKGKFDAIPLLLVEKLNEIIDVLQSSNAALNINLPNHVLGEGKTLADFFALFVEKENDEKNISDYIEALYTKVTETEPTSRTLQEIVDDMASRIVNVGEAQSGYDIVIRSDDEFSACLYPLYKDEENLTREQAAYIVDDNSAFNTPDPEFAAKRVLVKGVTFKKMRGYDDVRLHIFQPSIEYIKFEDCRWETHWKVSGKNPRDTSAANYNLNTSPERATAFNRATDILTLTIEGLHITEDNTSAARVSDQLGVGLRNIKALKNCYIDYPKNYKLAPEGYAALEMSCQFFDFADNCKISGLWDGTNVVNCKVSKIIRRCANVANMEAVNLLDQSGSAVPLSVEYCSNMVNLKGNVTLVSCTNISATREEAQAYADTAEENAKGYTDGKVATRRALLSGDGLNSGERFVYSVNKDIDPATGEAIVNQYRIHARTSANAGEIPLRTPHGTLLSPQEWYTSGYDYSNMSKWTPATLMPRNYIDTWFPKLNGAKKISTAHLPPYAPLVGDKVPAKYLPSYVDDVIEGYYLFNTFFKENDIHSEVLEKASGKIYLDLNTEKTYRWSGTKFVAISSSSIPSADDIGVYTKEDVDAMIGAITTIKKNTLVYDRDEGIAIDLLNKLVILKGFPELSADCRSISKNERWTVVECNIRQEAFALILSDEKYSFPCRLTLQDEGTNRTYADAYLIFEYNAKTKKIAYINFEFPSYEDFQYMDIIEANLELYTFEKTVLLGG